jgi:hypothetical protein
MRFCKDGPMFTTGRAARAAVTAVCALAVTAGCSGDDTAPDNDGLISVTTMRGALLRAEEVGPTWGTPTRSAGPQRLVSICGGTATPPEVPPAAEVVSAPLVDEGDSGAQTLEQTALVFPDETLAEVAQSALRAVAQTCLARYSVPAAVTNDRNEPAYVETVAIQELDERGWKGFVAIRHKTYDPAHPGTADTAVAVVSTKNVVLVDAYAIYRLNNASPSPTFDGDWKRLLGTVVQRVG